MSMDDIGTATTEELRHREDTAGILQRANRMHKVRNHMGPHSQLAALFDQKSVITTGYDRLDAVAQRANQVENMNLRATPLTLRY
jgi:hypothetical protein